MNTTAKDITVIIPCYNTPPAFLQEAVDSVKTGNGKCSYAIIIVDDGSTNEATVQLLGQLGDENTKVIFQENKGPAAARNTGVQHAHSEYILFLDSDDRLLPGYIEEGINALQANEKAGVVYSNAHAFGDGSRKNFVSRPFDIVELLLENYIPMCAVIKKQAWEDAGGIDERLVQYEDWEFWIRVYKAGWEFIFIDKPMFEYRIRQDSLIAQQPEENFKKAVACIYAKHWDLVYELYHKLYSNSIIYRNDVQRPFRSFIKYSKKKYLS